MQGREGTLNSIPASVIFAALKSLQRQAFGKEAEQRKGREACVGLSGDRAHQNWGGAVDGGKGEQAPLSHSGC